MQENCYLLDLERTGKTGFATYWRSGKQGYTKNLKSAGLYPKSEAEKIAKEDLDEMTVVIPEKVMQGIF